MDSAIGHLNWRVKKTPFQTGLLILMGTKNTRGTFKWTVGHKSNDPCVHKKYMEAVAMNFVAHCAV